MMIVSLAVVSALAYMNGEQDTTLSKADPKRSKYLLRTKNEIGYFVRWKDVMCRKQEFHHVKKEARYKSIKFSVSRSNKF